MFYLTHYERKVIFFLSLIIVFGAILKYTNFKIHESSINYSSQTLTLININEALEKDLEKIPHIGKKTAYLIVQYRKKYGNFTNIDDLLKIKGIGEKKLKIIKDHITF